MSKLLSCRRTFICLVSIGALLLIAIHNGTDTSSAIAMVAIGLAASNGAENVLKTMKKDP